MLDAISIDRALCLPTTDITALLRGQLIVSVSKVAIQKGWTFALYPYIESNLNLEQQYHSSTLPLAKTAIAQPHSLTIAIEAWAKCEHFMTVHDVEQLEALSRLTIWTKEALGMALEQRQRLFLSFLRVYRFPELITVPKDTVTPDKFGKFVGLDPLKVTQVLPVVSDDFFAQRKHRLEKLESPEHPELEELHCAIAQLAISNVNAKALENDIKLFLGWSEALEYSLRSSDVWIQEIAKTGNSSDGDRFEKLVRRSFIELGFSNSLGNPKASLDPESSGGAGGIDIYCQAPYPLVGECKASRHEHVPNSVSAQLIHLGHTHLGKAQFDQSLKVLFVAGRLTDPAQKAAVENQMNIMRPETLERLVTLKAKHPGVINLFDLKECLEAAPFGEESDSKVNRYIDQSWQQVKLRSHVISVVKKHLETMREKFADVNSLHVAYRYSVPPQSLERDELEDVLIELSSPLTGYLGRKKGSDGSDRFYFLRDLSI